MFRALIARTLEATIEVSHQALFLGRILFRAQAAPLVSALQVVEIVAGTTATMVTQVAVQIRVRLDQLRR